MQSMNLLSLFPATVKCARKCRPATILQRSLAVAAVALSMAVNQSAQAAGFTNTGAMVTAREGHTATLLPNGLVLVAGGYEFGGGTSTNTAELYDPANGTWTTTGAMGTARAYHTATLLPNGLVLVAGGYDNGTPTNSAELYDPANGTWTTTGAMATARYAHTATLLPNGLVLVAGGAYQNGPNWVALSSAELYDPANGTWMTTGAMGTACAAHTATLLPSGLVLVAGGAYDNGGNRASLSSAELYDPTSGTWTTSNAMAAGRDSHTATLLPNGLVLVAGGNDNGTVISSAELYDPTSGTWTNTGAMGTARYVHTATLLPNGLVLVAGGYDTSFNSLSSAELYDPITYLAFLSTPKPVSLRLTLNFAPGKLEQASVKASFALPPDSSLFNTNSTFTMVNHNLVLVPGVNLANQKVTLTVGGAPVEFTLTAKGQGVNGASRLKISLKPKLPKDGGTAQIIGTFTATLKGDFSAAWATAGLTNASVANKAVTVPVKLVFAAVNPTAFSIDKNLVYKANAGKSGQAK
jgi:N-acetylneuraminic acid mutarotase